MYRRYLFCRVMVSGLAMWASAASGNVILSLDFDGPDAAAGVRNGRLVAGVAGAGAPD